VPESGIVDHAEGEESHSNSERNSDEYSVKTLH